MAASGTQSTSRRANGVLTTSAQQPATDAPKPSKSRASVEGDKVIIRRLPPGMTEQELWNNLGDEWKAGNGLVGWHDFVQGKISVDPAKPSRPGRVYLQVLKRESLNTLATLVQTKPWEDAKMTYNSASLVGAPVLEFAIHNKVPSGKKRTDPRQGTIDQDPEFMSFLQSLTNPEMDKDMENSENKETEEAKPGAKVTTTPLIKFIKEKKANKHKEAAAAKSAKQARQESNTKGKASASTTEDSKKGRKVPKGENPTEKPHETVKILTKKATAEAVKIAETVASQITQPSSSSQDVPKSRRAGIAAAARILQRDLGISPGSAHRKARLDAAKAEAEAKTTTAKEVAQLTTEPATLTPEPIAVLSQPSSAASQTSERSTTATVSKSGRSRRGGGSKNAGGGDLKGKSAEANSTKPSTPARAPVVLLKKKDEEKNRDRSCKAEKEASGLASQSIAPNVPATNTKPNVSMDGKPSVKGGNSKKSAAAVTPGMTRGFVKHANASQSVTEALLKQALEVFGTVTSVEMDRRKGLAYVDFADHGGLVRAVTVGTVQVGQGTVQVLERKEKKPATSTSNAKSDPGSGNAGGGGGATNSDSVAPLASASANNTTPTEKAEQQHRRTRRGRGGGKGAANASVSTGGSKDMRNEPAGSSSTGTGL